MFIKLTGVEGPVAIDPAAIIEVRGVAAFPHLYGKAKSLVRRQDLPDLAVIEEVDQVLAKLEAQAEPTPPPQPPRRRNVLW